MTLPVHRRRTGMERYPAMRRDPFLDFGDLFDRLGSLLESSGGPLPVPEGMPWAPLADISETKDAYVVEVELPGVRKEDVHVEFVERELVISGELREKDEEQGELRRSTRRTGRFEYRAMLPGEVVTDDVHAKLTDGVLTVGVPKAQKIKPRRIEVETGE